MCAWKVERQQADGAAPATINRGLSILRRVCAWAVEQKLVTENPTSGLTDIPATPVSPRSLPDQAVDALLRAVRSEPDLWLRLRDAHSWSLPDCACWKPVMCNSGTWTWLRALDDRAVSDSQ